MTALGTVIGRGALASRPAAGTAGSLWYDTTGSQMTRDNGASWDVCEPAAGLSNPMTAAGQMIAGGASGAPVAVAAPTASTQVVSAINGAPFLSAPSAPSLATATTGGTVAAGVYQAELTLVNAQGETVASASASITTTGTTSTITVTSPAAAGSGTQAATGWYAYVTQAGGSTYTRQQTAGSPTAIGTNLVISAPPTSGGANPPGSNTAGTLIPGWTTGAGGGSSTLSGDTDVSISSPANLSQLQYQTGDSKWHNVGGGVVKLAETVLSASAASVTFSSISSSYRHLLIEWQARCDFSGLVTIQGHLNGDTGANYNFYRQTSAAGATGGSTGQTVLLLGLIASSADAANRAGAGSITIPNYAGTTFFKNIVSQSGWYDNLEVDFNEWASTAAITSLSLFPGGSANFIAGSTFTLYGKA